MKLLRRFWAASHKLAMMDAQTINTVLCAVADKKKKRMYCWKPIRKTAANGNVQSGNTTAWNWRERLEGIAADMRQVASLPSNAVRNERNNTPGTQRIRLQLTVPFGVVGEQSTKHARMSVLMCFPLFQEWKCVYSEGGSDADTSNRAIVQLIHGYWRV